LHSHTEGWPLNAEFWVPVAQPRLLHMGSLDGACWAVQPVLSAATEIHRQWDLYRQVQCPGSLCAARRVNPTGLPAAACCLLACLPRGCPPAAACCSPVCHPSFCCPAALLRRRCAGGWRRGRACSSCRPRSWRSWRAQLQARGCGTKPFLQA